MEGIIDYITIGVLIGIAVILWLAELERTEQRKKRSQWSTNEDRLNKQRHDILKELALKTPEKTEAKNQAVKTIYEVATSKNHFSLKDIENTTKQLQNHYSKTLETSTTFKMNFPEQELLHFEPRETLSFLIIINEGLHNATVHSSSNFIFNIASLEDKKLNIITHDNGTGYNRKEIPDGNGIKSILKATQELKGDLKLTSTAGNGTVVNFEKKLV